MSKQAKKPAVYPLPVEAPKPDKPLDTAALEYATTYLNLYAKKREELRLSMTSEVRNINGLIDFLLKGEEAYFQSLKNKVAGIIEGATRIA